MHGAISPLHLFSNVNFVNVFANFLDYRLLCIRQKGFENLEPALKPRQMRAGIAHIGTFIRAPTLHAQHEYIATEKL